MLATKTGASVDACTKLVSQVMGIGGDCGVPKPQLVWAATISACFCSVQTMLDLMNFALTGGVCFQWHLGRRQTSCCVLHQLILLGPRH